MKTEVSVSAGWQKRLSIILTIVAVLLLIHSILYAKLEIGHFGLIHSLPATFFVALALLTVASAILWVSKENHGKLLCLQLLLMISALWLIPIVIGGSTPFVDHGYRNLGLANYIVQEGYLSDGPWYLGWPGAHILLAMLTKVGCIDFGPVLNYVPFIMQLVCLLPLYIFLRNILGRERINYCWAGCWLFFLANWIGQDYLSPQGTAFLLLLTVLAVVTLPSLWEKGTPKLALLTAVGILAVAIAPIHLLTALALVLMLAALSIGRRTIRLIPIIGLCLAFIFLWDATGGEVIAGRVTSQPLWSPAMEGGVITLDPGAIAQTEVTQHLRGSESHIAVVQVRILHSAIFALIGLVGGIFVLFSRRKSGTVAILLMALAPLCLLPISGQYGEELLHRIYWFMLPFMAYFGAMLLDLKRKLIGPVLCLLLIFSCLTNVVSHYGNQAMDYFPPQRVAGMHFFDNNTGQGYVTGFFPLGQMNNILDYHQIGFDELEAQDGKLTTSTVIEEGVPYYVCLSRREDAVYEWYLGDPEFIEGIKGLLYDATNCNLIYANPDMKLYAVASK